MTKQVTNMSLLQAATAELSLGLPGGYLGLNVQTHEQ